MYRENLVGKAMGKSEVGLWGILEIYMSCKDNEH